MLWFYLLEHFSMVFFLSQFFQTIIFKRGIKFTSETMEKREEIFFLFEIRKQALNTNFFLYIFFFDKVYFQ